MLFPVFQKTADGQYKLLALYDDFVLMQSDFVDGKFDKTCHWEPWPVNMPFDEAFKGMAS